MNAVSRYDRLLISLAMAVLGAMALSGQARAQSAPQMLDRYGGEARGGTGPADPWAEAAVSAPAAFEGGALSWSGKSEAAPPVRMAYAPPPPMAYAPPPAWEAAPPSPTWSPAVHAAPAPKARGVAPTRTPAAVRAASVRPSAPPLPASIYAPPPQTAELAPQPPAAPPLPAPPRVAAQGAGGSSVRHYSVHREFGITPDPTPIPPQFFTATADLSAQSAAEAEPLSRNPSTQTGSARTRARAAAAPADPS